MKKKIFITRTIPHAGISLLEEQEELEVQQFEDCRAPSREELRHGLKDAAALLCLLSDRVDDDLLSEAPKLKVIANYAVGYDNIDVKAAGRRGIWVSNTPGVLTEATADLAFALILSTARRLVEADEYTRKGLFRGWAPELLLGMDLAGATLGIVGMGRIGSAVARRAQGFGMKILYHNRRACEEEVEKGLEASYTSLDELLRQSDVISLHLPGGQETHHMIAAREIGLMKTSAILINTGRGSLIDEKYLVTALRERKIAAAGLDVFEREPELAEGLAELNNVVILPHIGSATVGTRSKMAVMAAQNIIAALSGDCPPNAVNKEFLIKE